MPDYVGTLGTPVSPWGVNEFLRSTKEFGTESYTLAMGSVPRMYRDGNLQKELKAGVVLAKITSGNDAGKVGPFCSTTGTAEVQTITPSGTWAGTGGTYRVGADLTNPLNYADLAPAATAAQLQTALRAMPAYADYQPTVSGGPLTTGAFTITYGSGDVLGDVPQVQFSAANLTGGTTPNAAVATGTPGVGGIPADGRQTLANIVGLNLTTLPWQTLVRDVEVSAVYDAECVQGWCLEMTASGLFVPLTNTTAAAMQRGGGAGKMVDIGWH